MRRYPAFLWVPVYVGSLLILNGGHPDWAPGQLALGIGLVVLACALATYLALGPWPGRPRPAGMGWVFAGVTGFYGVTAIAAGAFVGPDAGLATLLAGVIPLTAVSIWVAHTRVKTAGREDDHLRDAFAEDHEDPVPGIGLESSRPLGDTPAAHDELIPQDLPKDHPGRLAAEEQAAALGGTTPGHAEGGAAGDGDGEPAPQEELVDPEESHRGARFGRDVPRARASERRRTSRR
jgi:hypothetical protein